MTQPLLRPAGILEDEYGLELLTLDILCLKKYGPSYIDWDSEALRTELTEDFGPVGDITWQRIQAVRLLHKNDSFWKEWEVFEKVASAVLGDAPIFSYAQPPEADELAIVIDTASRVAGNSYSDDVLGYMAAACLHDGVWYLEDPLDIAQSALSEHDKRKNIEREYPAVASRLQDVTEYITQPDGLVDVQVNHVLGIRKAVASQQAIVKAQTLKLPSLIGE
tara:strand:+ start:839 stop:1501 length:663 start_codon:yes stop_codon:yes gene_type:complete